MPLTNPQTDDEVLIDASVPLSGVNNSIPPSALDRTTSADAENRLTRIDALNRPRPGLIRLKHTTSGLDSIHHLGGGQYLANDAANWYKYDGRNNVLASASGGPAYSPGDQVYSALANNVLYFSNGGVLRKYDPVVGFGTVTMQSQYPTALFPIWAVNRLIYAYQNTIVCSDVLNPEFVDVITDTLTIDPNAADAITGLALWQDQQICMFRNGATWLANSGPGLAVPDWTLNRVSGKIGCRAHGTIQQCEADLYFLSETGRGVYALSQAPASEQAGVWVPLSADIQAFINRINWAAADNARATYWNGLYLLSVPLDSAPHNNFMLIYSVLLQKWQGLWCFDWTSQDIGFRDAATDRTNVNESQLIFATIDGIISKMTYPEDLQDYDLNEDGTKQPIESHLMTRAFTFGEDINQIRPHSIRFKFLESQEPVNITIYGDRTIELVNRTLETNSYLLSLPVAGLPFDLDREGFATPVVSLLHTGLMHELQVYMEGFGNWTVYELKASAFEAMPQIAT